jgi:hypothetical protein
MKHKHYLLGVILIASLFSGIARSQIKYNDEIKKSSMTTEEAMEYYLDELKKDPYVKKHFGWKLFFAQHPMYLIVDEDRGEPAVGERIPPWGAETKEGYIERVRRNLTSLEKLPNLKLNYQWSALEVEHMCRHFPDVHERMKKLYAAGSLDFLDGTYSQAHLQSLTSESNWRQFEVGLELYKSLFDKKMDIYARQETGLHHQLPQLLNHFGYIYAASPAFVTTVEIFEGPFEFIVQEGQMEAINGDGLIESVGLDGSSIPFYLTVGLGWSNMKIERELQQDLYSGPRIFNVFPDLDEVDKEDFEENYQLFDWVLFKDALIEIHKEYPPRARGRVSTNWSYNEGVWAEELFRAMRRTEAKVLLAEQMNAMVRLSGQGPDKSLRIKKIWKTILKSQHHDISWIEVTDLKRKSINRLNEAFDDCDKIITELSEVLIEKNGEELSIFNGQPGKRNALIELNEQASLGEKPFQVYKENSFGFASLSPGGYKSFKKLDTVVHSEKTDNPDNINTKYYSIQLSKNGLIKQFKTQRGKQLLKDGPKLGGEIRARIDREWYDNRDADVNYLTGPVCDIVERKTKINNIPLTETYFYYKDQPYIKVELEFDFNGNEVGYMWFDETKLNVYYPTVGEKVHHDIPFGYIEAKQNRPLLAANWVECGGLVYVHRGNVKHWVKDGVIANVLAWGDNQFSNRIHWDWIEYTEYDIRLYGKQKIEYYIIPQEEFDGTQATHLVEDIISPVHVQAGVGNRSFYSVDDPGVAVTAIYLKNDQVYVRGYKLPGNGNEGLRDWEIFNLPVDEVK